MMNFFVIFFIILYFFANIDHIYHDFNITCGKDLYESFTFMGENP